MEKVKSLHEVWDQLPGEKKLDTTVRAQKRFGAWRSRGRKKS
jgi:hypothetical protein